MWRNLLYIAVVLYLKSYFWISTRAFMSFQLVTRILPHHFLPGFCSWQQKFYWKQFFSGTIVKPNGQNNCIKRFPFSRYKEKQVSLLVTSQKDSIFSSQKILNIKQFFLWCFKHWRRVWFSQEDNTCNTPFFRRPTGSSSWLLS